jgi:alpha-ketoglutarate-dependent taurine dioxygenase
MIVLAAVKDKHGEVSRRTLTNWSRTHSWQERVAEHDRELERGFQVHSEALDANFDRVDALRKVADMALKRVLQSNPVVRTPQDAKDAGRCSEYRHQVGGHAAG